ncbi:MAG: twin-arginine translocase subunit TatC [Dehalococcoidia bacterium]
MAEQGMTLREHLDELRKRLFFSLAVVLVGAIVAFIFRAPIIEFLLAPGFGQFGTRPQATEVLETVSVIFKIAIMAGFVAALPVILYQLIMFVSPGLTSRERLYLFLFLPGVLAAFVAGVAFGYYVLFPPALGFLFTFGSEFVDNEFRIASYMNIVTSLMFWMGVVFQIPIVMFGLARLGVLRARQMARFRRFGVVLAFVAAAIITPTFDPVNQVMVAMPILVLYEFGLLMGKLGERLRRGPAEKTRTPGRMARAKARVRRWAGKLRFWKR